MRFLLLCLLMMFVLTGRAQDIAITPQMQPETAAIMSALSNPTGQNAWLINNAILELMAAGVWQKMVGFWWLRSTTSLNAAVNWKNPGTYNLTFVNSPTLTVCEGVAGNGITSYINTNFNPATAGSVYAQNSASFGVWINDVGGAGALVTDMSAFDGTRGAILRVRNASNKSESRLNDGTTSTSTADNATEGLTAVSRTASGSYRIFKNGVATQTFSVASTGMPSQTFFIGALNNSGTPAQRSTRQYLMAFIAEGLTDEQMLILYRTTANLQPRLCT